MLATVCGGVNVTSTIPKTTRAHNSVPCQQLPTPLPTLRHKKPPQKRLNVTGCLKCATQQLYTQLVNAVPNIAAVDRFPFHVPPGPSLIMQASAAADHQDHCHASLLQQQQQQQQQHCQLLDLSGPQLALASASYNFVTPLHNTHSSSSRSSRRRSSPSVLQALRSDGSSSSGTSSTSTSAAAGDSSDSQLQGAPNAAAAAAAAGQDGCDASTPQAPSPAAASQQPRQQQQQQPHLVEYDASSSSSSQPQQQQQQAAAEDAAAAAADDDGQDTPGVRMALAALKWYKGFLSPSMASTCRFQPTCSVYSMDSYRKYGVAKGTVLTAWRLLRCNPWGGSGYDPTSWPPIGLAPLFTLPYSAEVAVVVGTAVTIRFMHALLFE